MVGRLVGRLAGWSRGRDVEVWCQDQKYLHINIKSFPPEQSPPSRNTPLDLFAGMF